LLVSADAVFGALVRDLIDFDLANLISHLVLAAVCAWVTVGFLIGLVLTAKKADPPLRLPQFLTLKRLEVGVTLGALNLLFLSFIVIQLRYLFGDAELVQVTPGLTYAEYARRGFFELVAVVALALPVLLAADWLLGAGGKLGFRVLSAAMVLLLFVILLSAFHRMRLYQAEYGWTELRLYVLAFMGWLAAVLAWFAATVLRSRRQYFVGGGIVAGFFLVFGLHVWNPDAWIVQRNLAAAGSGRAFDAAYAVRLSADAAPVLARALPELPPGDRELVREWLAGWSDSGGSDWRLWSWSRAKAKACAAELPSGRFADAQ
jgi:hypothetical protein